MVVSVAFVDDHPILLDGLAQAFSANDGYRVVGTGGCTADALRIVGDMRPDVLVMDLSMPGNPLETIQKVGEMSPPTKIVIFTASANIDLAVRTLEVGATGYVLKGCTAAELSAAIQSVLAGDTFVTPSFATTVIAALRNAALRKTTARAVKLSIREDQIVRLLLRGWTNKEIANQLCISEKTVKNYMTLLMQKLNVRNRLEVIIATQKLGEEYRALPEERAKPDQWH